MGDAHENKRNRATFNVEATREIANDWATARLSVSAEGKDPAVVANEVNTQMAAALKTAKRASGVTVESGAYVTHPVYDSNRIVRWRAQQEIRLESEDVDKLSELIGKLQSDRVALSGIDFSVKRETREKMEDELVEEALAAFRARAALIAKGMSARDWSLVEMNVGQQRGGREQRFGGAQMRTSSLSEAAPPSFEAGTSDLQVNVSGTVELE
jgi:predicted secreted protein